MGPPVTAVDAGALGELCVGGETGFLLPVDDVTAMSDALQQYLDSKKLRTTYGKNSAKLARTHDVKTVIPKFVDLYEQVIAENS